MLKEVMNEKCVWVTDNWHMMWPTDVMFKSILFEKAEQVFEIIAFESVCQCLFGFDRNQLGNEIGE